MQLFVKSNAGPTMVVAVDAYTGIHDLQALCEEKGHSKYGDFAVAGHGSRYLTYGGVPLQPQRSLADYGIPNNATLESCDRLRGGCFAFSIMLWIIIFTCLLLSICTCGLSLPVAFCLVPIALLLPLCCL